MSLAKTSTNNIKAYFYLLVSGIALIAPLTVQSNEQGNESTTPLITVSVGLNKAQIEQQSSAREASVLLTKNESLGLLAQSNITREQNLAAKAEASKNQTVKEDNNEGVTKIIKASKTSSYHHSFSIYNAFSYLLDDYDSDGYYQTFSVVFDADLHSYSALDSAEVYAELYLSKNGGPWIYYYTTDNFNIYGDSEDDEYEVITTLHQGYDSDSYDVLIDLYEVGYQELVATYSSDDNNALYALPLESSDYDIEYVVEVYEGHAGSMSLYLLLSLFGIRLFLKSNQSKIVN